MVLVLQQYIEAHNRGVRTGDFSDMIGLLLPEAELQFVGAEIGPFTGREKIGEAFQRQPPTDELVMMGVPEMYPDGIAVVYGWKKYPNTGAGMLKIEEHEGKIKRVTVTFAESGSSQAK